MTPEHAKLTVYFGERSTLGEGQLADALLTAQARQQVAGSVLLRGIQGFGAKHLLRTDRLLTLSEDLPLVCVAVDTQARLEALMSDLGSIGTDGLATLERLQLLEQASAAEHLAKLGDEQVKLTVYLGRHERVARKPAFVAVCEVLHAAGAAGATVLLGVDGTRAGERLRAKFFARNDDVPLMIVTVGSARELADAVRELAGSLVQPLITLERVGVCMRDGQHLGEPQRSAAGQTRPGTRQRLTVVVSEAAQHEGRSIHLELVERLRASGVAGATSMRGIWGFHGAHAPHGDRLLAIRRRVPVVTEILDVPERISAAFEIARELTSERGLVFVETVVAGAALDQKLRLN